MNYPVILKILSMLFAIMAAAFSLSAGVSLFYYADSPLEGEAMPAWISIIALSVLLAFAFSSRAARRRERFSRRRRCA